MSHPARTPDQTAAIEAVEAAYNDGINTVKQISNEVVALTEQIADARTELVRIRADIARFDREISRSGGVARDALLNQKMVLLDRVASVEEIVQRLKTQQGERQATARRVQSEVMTRYKAARQEIREGKTVTAVTAPLPLRELTVVPHPVYGQIWPRTLEQFQTLEERYRDCPQNRPLQQRVHALSWRFDPVAMAELQTWMFQQSTRDHDYYAGIKLPSWWK
jgi:chromosome segregation ATPase